MKQILAWVAWWVALFWLWMLLAGEWNRVEWVAAVAAAAIGATLGEFARTRTGFSARLPSDALMDVPQALAMVLVDFGILVRVLVVSIARRRVVRGRFVSRELEGGRSAARGVGPRAWTALAASYSPNAYVLDIEPESGTVLLHDLVPNLSSERPA